MKKYTILLLSFIQLALIQGNTQTPPAVYYSKPTGNLHELATWGSNPDGTGAAPSSFLEEKTYMLANRAGIYEMTADWTIGGTFLNPAGNELRINGYTLTFVGTITGEGTLAGSRSSNVTVAGSGFGSAGGLRFTPGSQKLNHFMALRSGRLPSVDLLSPLEIYGTFKINRCILVAHYGITLKSDALGTARMLPSFSGVTEVSPLMGPLVVERYIPARRAWRFLRAPGANINSTWQEGGINVSANPNPAPGYGTHITGGPLYGTVANGFDQNPGAASSLKQYNNLLDKWVEVNSTYQPSPVTPFMAYMIFIRGDRSISLGSSAVPPTPTTLRSQLELPWGDRGLAINSGFTVLSNPYPSPIDFSTIFKINMQNSFWVWDPKLGGANGVGAWVNVSFNGSGWDVTPASASPQSQIIQMDQGFLVRSLTNSGIIVFNQSCMTDSPTQDVYRAPLTSSLRITLMARDEDGSFGTLDEILSSQSNRYSEKLDEMDAAKPANVEENMAIANGNEPLMVERRPDFRKEDGLQLQLWNLKQKTYFLEFAPQLLADSLQLWLVDNYLQTVIPIAKDGNTRVSFTVTNEASAQPYRFTLRTSPEKPVPATLVHITAYPNPLSGKVVHLSFMNMPKGCYQVQLLNSMGQVILSRTVIHPGGTIIHDMELHKVFPEGMYRLHINGGTISKTLPLLVN